MRTHVDVMSKEVHAPKCSICPCRSQKTEQQTHGNPPLLDSFPDTLVESKCPSVTLLRRANPRWRTHPTLLRFIHTVTWEMRGTQIDWANFHVWPTSHTHTQQPGRRVGIFLRPQSPTDVRHTDSQAQSRPTYFLVWMSGAQPHHGR